MTSIRGELHIRINGFRSETTLDEFSDEYDFELSDSINGPYHGIVVAVNHNEYAHLNESYFQSIAHPGAVFADLKGIYRGMINSLDYWSL